MNHVPQLILAPIDTTAYSALYLAVSGGKDSITLFHALKDVWGAHKLHVLHIDHAQHARSHTIAHELKNYIESQGCNCTVYRLIDTVPGASETTLRQKRYDAFATLLPTHACLFMAHHYNDSLETTLLGIVRFSSIRNVCGIPRKRQYKHFTILRPFIDTTRQSIDAYHAYYQLPLWEDPSNTDVRIGRNYIRHRVLPHIMEKFQRGSENIHAFQEQLAHIQYWADEAIHAAVRHTTQTSCLSHAALKNYQPTLWKDIIAAWLHHMHIPLSRAKIDTIILHITHTPRAYDVVEGLSILSAYHVTLVHPGPLPSCHNTSVNTLHPHATWEHVFGTFTALQHCIVTVSTPTQDIKASKKRAQNMKIPVWLRPLWPIIQTDNGQWKWWSYHNDSIVLTHPSPLGHAILQWCTLLTCMQ